MVSVAGMNSRAKTRRISASEGRGTGSGALLMVVVAVAGGLSLVGGGVVVVG
jgi:hypothetical protein